jgi:hypothetical protein
MNSYVIDLNLAESKYKKIYSCHGGPIKKLVYWIDEFSNYNFLAQLREDLIHSKSSNNETLYNNNFDGQGSSKLKNVAAYKAISEALERWAFYESRYHVNDCAKYGFNVDNSTSGMSAYPGLTGLKAQQLAWLEAIERWSICSWWEGYIGVLEINDDSLYRLLTPWSHIYCFIMLKVSSCRTFTSYGFGCGVNHDIAYAGAEKECQRNYRSLKLHYENLKLGCKNMNYNLFEKRLVYFSSLEGSSKFFSKVNRCINPVISKPKLIVNKMISGPWASYTHVHRCLFEPKVLPNEELDYFLF